MQCYTGNELPADEWYSLSIIVFIKCFSQCGGRSAYNTDLWNLHKFRSENGLRFAYSIPNCFLDTYTSTAFPEFATLVSEIINCSY